MAGARPGGKISPGLGGADRRQSAAGGHGAGLLSSVRERLQSQGSRRLGQHSCGRALPRRHGGRRGLEAVGPRRAERQAGAGGRRRAERPVGRLPPHPARPSGGDPRSGAGAGRHDAFRDSRLPAAARRPFEGSPPHRGDGRAHRPRPQGRGPARREGGRELRRGVRGGRRPRVAPRRHPGARRRPGARCGEPLARRQRRRPAQARTARGDLWRRQHRDGCGPHRQAARRRGGHHRLSPRPRAYAGACLRGRRGDRGGRQDQVADHHQGVFRLVAHRRGHGDRRQGAPAADRAVRDAGGGRRGAGARPADRIRPSSSACRGSSSRTRAWSRSAPT